MQVFPHNLARPFLFDTHAQHLLLGESLRHGPISPDFPARRPNSPHACFEWV